MGIVKGLYYPGKIENPFYEMIRLKISIFKGAEHKWPGNYEMKHQSETFFYFICE